MKNYAHYLMFHRVYRFDLRPVFSSQLGRYKVTFIYYYSSNKCYSVSCICCSTETWFFNLIPMNQEVREITYKRQALISYFYAVT